MKFFLILFLIGVGAGGFFLYKNGVFHNSSNSTPVVLQKAVKGIETSTNDASSSSAVSGTINALQSQAKDINLNQLATASPQIQDLIKQIQNLPQVPLNSAKNACVQICNKL